jgi:hypothetical protein
VKSWALFFFLLSVAGARASELELLRSNGNVFYRAEERMPLRCLDAPILLAMGEKEQEALLDKAAAAGFNSVSFPAPLFGEGSFCEKLGSLDSSRVDAFHRLIEKIENRRLYAFPVLWNSDSVAAFSKIGGGDVNFFTGKEQNQWQAWLLRETVKASSVSVTAGIGGWILYRGPWPGPKQRQDKTAGASLSTSNGAQAFTAGQRAWLQWQVRALRQGGAIQLAGIGYLLKGDLDDKKAVEAADLGSLAAGPPPVSDKMKREVKLQDSKDLDKLPMVSGAGLEEREAAGAEPLTPWDLEGIDWGSVGKAMNEVPMATGLDFMELTLDTEDWYRVGDAMSEMADREMQTPLLWRQDWRGVSHYERQKHLEAPAGLAGLMGPWPDSDWPEVGESIWPMENSPKLTALPLLFKYMEVTRDEEGRPAIALHLNRPAEIDLKWGKTWPLSKHSASKEPALVHVLPLKGAHFEKNIVFMAKAKSRKWGTAVLKIRWTALKEPAKHPAPVGKKPHKAKKR